MASSSTGTTSVFDAPAYVLHPPAGWASLMFNPPIKHGTPVRLTKLGRAALAGKLSATSLHHQANHQLKQAMQLLLHAQPHLVTEKKLEKLIKRHTNLYALTGKPITQVFYMWLRVATRLDLVLVEEPGQLERWLIKYEIGLTRVPGIIGKEDKRWIASSSLIQLVKHKVTTAGGPTPYAAVRALVRKIRKGKKQ